MVNILLGAFNSLEESRKGTLRSLIAFSFLVLFNLIYIYLTGNTTFPQNKKYVYICIAYFISLVLLTSAIGVQIPNTAAQGATETKPATTQVVTYGLCLGLVVYGFLNINMYTMFKQWTFAIALRYTAFGIVSVTLSALFTYYCSKHANLF
jgi:hypothetical protein